MGEFGAVSVVSGHIRGLTNTLPLHVEILYNEYNHVAAFSVASLLLALALLILLLKAVERIAPCAPANRSTCMSIEVRNVNKRFGQFQALNNINLDIHSGELVALLGPSGCGKTSLLRIIAGLETPDTGSIAFHGEDVSGHDVRDRNVGFVFQHYALFRHMTVFDNVAFGLRMKPKKQRPSEAVIAQKVRELLGLVQLDWLADRYPEQLSGGQRQRIALARALAVEPRVLLLDEPFGALDAKVRKELRRWLARLHEDVHLTSVFVTHDQEEAMEVADRIVVMNKGVIEQVGTPAEVYRNPASEFVYDFLAMPIACSWATGRWCSARTRCCCRARRWPTTRSARCATSARWAQSPA